MRNDVSWPCEVYKSLTASNSFLKYMTFCQYCSRLKHLCWSGVQEDWCLWFVWSHSPWNFELEQSSSTVSPSHNLSSRVRLCTQFFNVKLAIFMWQFFSFYTPDSYEEFYHEIILLLLLDKLCEVVVWSLKEYGLQVLYPMLIVHFGWTIYLFCTRIGL